MFFEKLLAFRLREDEYRMLIKIYRKSKDKYDSESHFIRCAVLKLVREEKRRLKIRGGEGE